MMRESTRVLKALANERRLKILKILFEKGPLPVGDISSAINLSFRSTSRHLLLMEKVNLLTRKQVKTSVFYDVAKPDPAAFPGRILSFIKGNLIR